MAFMGMVIIAIVLLLLLIAFTVMVTLFVLAIVFKIRKKTVPSIICTTVGTLILAAFIYLGVVIFGPKSVKIVTPTGEITKISRDEAHAFTEAISQEDFQTVITLMDKYPDLIYYSGFKEQPPLDKASNTLNIEIVQFLLDHGAKYDDKFTHKDSIYHYSLESFLTSQSTEDFVDHSVEINNMVRFMLENGASVDFDNTFNANALFIAVWHICYDGEIQSTDLDLLQMLIDYGADIKKENSNGEHAADYLKKAAEQHFVDPDNEYYKTAEQMLLYE